MGEGDLSLIMERAWWVRFRKKPGMSMVFIGSMRRRIPASSSAGAANLRFSTKVSWALAADTLLGSMPGEAVDLLAVQRGGVLDGFGNAVAELAYPVGVAGDAALARVPVAGGQVVENLREAVGLESLGQRVGVVVIREKVLDATESGAGGRPRTCRGSPLR